MEYLKPLFPKHDEKTPKLQKFWVLWPWVQIYLMETLTFWILLEFAVAYIWGFSLRKFQVVFFLFWGLLAAKHLFWYFYDNAHKKSIEGDVCLVTGGAGGLGRRICDELLTRKLKALIIWDLNEELSKKTVEEMKKYCSDNEMETIVTSNVVDVSSYESVKKGADELIERFGRLDILVNNAGIYDFNRIYETSPERLQKVMDVNSTSNLWTIKVFLKGMMERKHGHIVCVSSTCGMYGGPITVAYGGSKFATFGMMDSLRLDLKYLYKVGDYVHTLLVCPHYFDSKLFAKARCPSVQRLKMTHIATRSVDAIEKKRDVIFFPQYFAWSYLNRFLCQYFMNNHLWYADWWTHLLGVTESMDDWEKKKEK